MTGTAIINAPLQFVEYLRFKKRIEKEKVTAPVFILGHPRSGTTHLHYLLSKDDRFGFCTVYQGILPHLFLTGGKIFKKLIGSAMPETRPQDNVQMSIDSPKEEEFALSNMSDTSYMFGFYFPKYANKHFKASVIFETGERDKAHWKKHFAYFLKKLTYSNKGKQLLLKSPANTGRIKEILELFPDAKFIHIHRDPIEVYQSTIRLYEKIIPITSFQQVGKEEIKEYVIESYRKMYQKFITDYTLIPKGNFSEISYEELISKPAVSLERVYQELKLDGFEQALVNMKSELNESKDYKKNSYQSMDPATITRLQKEWRDIIKYFGY